MTSKKIKMLLTYRDSNATELAKKLGCSTANISQKLKRDNFSEKELLEIANILNCDLSINFIDRESGKEF